MKNIILILFLFCTSFSFSQKIDFRSDLIIIDRDTNKTENLIYKINLTDKIFVETYIDSSGLINHSSKRRIIKESVKTGIVSFRVDNGIDYRLEIFEDHAELTVDSDKGLKWIGKYEIDFSIMLRK